MYDWLPDVTELVEHTDIPNQLASMATALLRELQGNKDDVVRKYRNIDQLESDDRAHAWSISCDSIFSSAP
jgi:DNA polymerase III psi subunit